MDLSTSHERRIADLEDQRYQAVIDGNYDVLERLCHDQLVYTHSSGNRDSLSTYLEKLRTGRYVYHRIDHPIEKVILMRNAALVVSQMNANLTVNGTPLELTNNCLSIWVEEDGNWTLLAFQATHRASR